MRRCSSGRRGISVVELTLYAMVGSFMLAFFLLFFSRTWRTHEQQNLEITYQGSFNRLCEQMERDLTGCKSWEIHDVVGSSTSLSIDRFDGQITYDVRFEKGEIVRRHLKGDSVFPFKGERPGILKTLDYITDADRPAALTLKIGLATVPEIELTHDFIARISVDNVSGFFEEVDLEERGATGVIGAPQPQPVAPTGLQPGCAIERAFPNKTPRKLPKRPQ